MTTNRKETRSLNNVELNVTSMDEVIAALEQMHDSERKLLTNTFDMKKLYYFCTANEEYRYGAMKAIFDEGKMYFDYHTALEHLIKILKRNQIKKQEEEEKKKEKQQEDMRKYLHNAVFASNPDYSDPWGRMRNL